jgi:hypothetical protein
MVYASFRVTSPLPVVVIVELSTTKEKRFLIIDTAS